MCITNLALLYSLRLRIKCRTAGGAHFSKTFLRLRNFCPWSNFVSVRQDFSGNKKKKKKEGKEYESSHRRANARNESLEGAKKRSKCQAFGSRFSGWLARARFVQGKRVYTLAHTDRGHEHTGDIGRTWSGWFVETGCKL